MSHPSSCQDPDVCQLTYREHLLGIAIAASALPTRAVHRTEGLPDEPVTKTRARQKRFDENNAAYKALREQGYRPKWGQASTLAKVANDSNSDDCLKT